MPKEKVKKRIRRKVKMILLCRFYNQSNFWMGMHKRLINSTEVPLVLKFDNQDFYFYPSKIKIINYNPANYINYSSGLDSYYQLKTIEAYFKITTQENISKQITLLSLKKDFLLSKFKELKNSLNHDDYYKEFEHKFFTFRGDFLKLKRKVCNYSFEMNVQERDNEYGQKLRNEIEEDIIIGNRLFDTLNNEILNLIIMKQQKNEALQEKMNADREINNILVGLRQDQPSTSTTMNLGEEVAQLNELSSPNKDEIFDLLLDLENQDQPSTSTAMDLDDELQQNLIREEQKLKNEKMNADREINNILVGLRQDQPSTSTTMNLGEEVAQLNELSSPNKDEIFDLLLDLENQDQSSTSAAMDLDDELQQNLIREEQKLKNEKMNADREINNILVGLRQGQPSTSTTMNLGEEVAQLNELSSPNKDEIFDLLLDLENQGQPSTSAVMNLDDELQPYLIREEPKLKNHEPSTIDEHEFDDFFL